MKRESANPDFVQLEKEVLKLWETNNCFLKLKEKNNNSNKYYAFLDGPITANNAMGIHHALGRSLKDIYIKFKALDGYNQKYQNGFDAHGLPVETAVEKELGIKNKKEILEYGLDNFVEKCIERVNKYSNIITEQSKQLGQMMDWDNSYFTNSDENITTIWYFLKKCFDKGWLVKSSKAMQWCPRCGTSLSEHEMHGSYKDVEHAAVFFKAPLADGRVVLVWTTTPWTLTSNVAIAVNPDNYYLEVKVKSDSRTVIIGKEAIKVLKDDLISVIREFKGSEIVGKVYETCFEEIECQNFEHKIVPWEDVTASEGTGFVHIAPGCGEEDFGLGKKLELKEICPIDESGIILKEFGIFAGISSSDVRALVFEELKKRNKLYYTHKFKHSYPICWRCKEEIVFRLVDGWFIKVDEIRPLLVKAIDEVEFEPAFMKKRMLDWLNNLGDWNISRSRFYGIPLPIYICENGHINVIGSLEELKKRSSNVEVEKLPHLHRPYIDEIKIKCTTCGKESTRITEVGDCWLDAGITPYSTNMYFKDKNYWQKNCPADVVIEMREQIRLWFYSLLFMSVVLENKAPYKKIVAHESVVQEDGNKFSKSGFMIRFDDFANKLGADTARYMFASTPLQSVTRFGYSLGEEARRKMLGYWNAYTFFITYAIIDKPNLKNKPKQDQLDNTDKWLIQITNDFIKDSYDNYNKNQAFNVVKDFENLSNDLTNFYIRANRRRFWKSEDAVDKRVAYWCLYNCLKSIALVMSPIIPFMSEHIWQNMVRNIEEDATEFIFLNGYPKTFFECDYSNYLKYTDITKNIITIASRLRNEKQLKVKQPLSKAYIVSVNKEVEKSVKIFEDLIKDELNIKEILFLDNGETFNDQYLTINFKNAGAILKGEVQKLKQILEKSNLSDMQKLVEQYKNGVVEIQPFGKLKADNFILNAKPKEEFVIAQDNNITVVLDTVLTKELINEGLLREIIRNAQILRKVADFQIDARVKLNITSTDEKIKQLLKQNSDKIKQEVLAVEFNKSDFIADIEKIVDLDGKNIEIALKCI